MTPVSEDDQGKPAETIPAPAAEKHKITALPVAGEAQVTFSQSPSKPADGKQIHARRPLPMTSEGQEGS